MPKALKTQKPKQKTVKPTVVSFRMTSAQYKHLEDTTTRTNVIGAESPRQFARKIICDYLNGKLQYKDPKDLRTDSENYGK